MKAIEGKTIHGKTITLTLNDPRVVLPEVDEDGQSDWLIFFSKTHRSMMGFFCEAGSRGNEQDCFINSKWQDELESDFPIENIEWWSIDETNKFDHKNP